MVKKFFAAAVLFAAVFSGYAEERRWTIEELNRAIAQSPQNAPLYFERGERYFEQHQNEKAYQDFKTASMLATEDMQRYYYQGRALCTAGMTPEGIEAYTKAIRINPNDYSGLYYWRGQAYEMMKDMKKALGDYNKAAAMEPEHPSIYLTRGKLYMGEKEYQKALSDFDKTVLLAPRALAGYQGRGQLLLFMGKPREALADLNRAVEIAPQDDWGYYLRGLAYNALKEYQKAVIDLTKAIETHSELGLADFSLTFYERGKAYRNMKEYQKAIHDFTESINLIPMEAFRYKSRAETYLEIAAQTRDGRQKAEYKRLAEEDYKMTELLGGSRD